METSVFTRSVTACLTDDQYRALQIALVLRPDQGPVIAGSGGLRKVRWSVSSHGKRGGVRVIYFWQSSRRTIYMLLAFKKNEKENLAPSQLRALRRLIREGFR